MMIQNVAPSATERAPEHAPNVDKTPLELWVHIAPKPDALAMSYSVTNTRRHAVYLLNVLWDLTPKGQYEPSKLPLYSCLRSNGELHLAKMILPAPKAGEVEMRIVPFATKVEPGKTFEEKLQLPIPVGEHNPYFPVNAETKTKSAEAHSVFFTLHFMNDSPEMEAQASPLPGAVRLYHPKLLALVETLHSRPEAVSVKVQKRDGHFEEF